MSKNLYNIKLFNKVRNLFFPFYKSEEIKIIFKIFEKDQPKNKNVAMFVGGCVRKFILGDEIDDIDIATIFSPEEIKSKFKNTDIKIIETGLDHGSITLVLNKKKFEVTTLRKDLKTDGRHAEVSFTEDWQLDSERRDFTFNAIYLNRKGKIFDPQLGLNDLERGVVKFIGDPNKRIEEDFLRIIRFIRFAIEYNHQDFEKSTLDAIKLNLNGIASLSKERVLSELLKILNSKNFFNLVNNKDLKDIFSLVFPELKYLDRLKKLKLMPDNESVSESVLLGTLLIDKNNSDCEYFCHKYKTSNELKKKLLFLNKLTFKFYEDRQFFRKNIKKNAYYFGKDKVIVVKKLEMHLLQVPKKLFSKLKEKWKMR